MRSVHAVSLVCAALALTSASAAAQAPVADTALARATAATILDGGGRGRGPDLFLLAPPADRFDTLTAVELLAQAPGRQDPEADYALYIGTRGVQLAGDTAVVTVVMHQQTRNTGMNWWEQIETFRFVPEGDGWRFVQRVFVRHSDGGSVRGALDRPGPPVALGTAKREWLTQSRGVAERTARPLCVSATLREA